jgi:transposase-like protein
MENLFKWKHFESHIILLCTRWYLKYPLSYRNLEEMMAERGLSVIHTTIMRWVHQYSSIINRKVKKHLKPTNDSWRTDETYIKIKGKWCYLSRVVDSKGNTIDFWLSKNRDKKSAKKFFKKALGSSHNQMPRVITTDKYYTYEVLINELIYSSDLSCRTQHRKIQYLNNIIEQDHRFIKKITNPTLGFKNFKSACSVISGIETFHILKKKQAGMMTPMQEVEFIHKLMNVG